MRTVYTIGYHGRSLANLVQALRAGQVSAVIDVRLRNTSHLAGYTKRDDLAFLLTEGFGIAYEHRPELAPTDGVLDVFKQGGAWSDYETAFGQLLVERGALEIGRELLSRYDRPCLLCAESAPDHCHRRLIAEYWAAHLCSVDIQHL